MDYSYWIARIQASRTSKFDWRDQPIFIIISIQIINDILPPRRTWFVPTGRYKHWEQERCETLLQGMSLWSPLQRWSGASCAPLSMSSQSEMAHTGVALKLRRGLSTPRYIFIPHQMQTQIELATSLMMLREVATNNKQGSRTRWRWFQDDDDSLTRFRTKARKLGKAHHSEVVSRLFNLVTRADALSNRYRISNLPCKMRLRDFKNLEPQQGSYRIIDPISSRQGICQRQLL